MRHVIAVGVLSAAALVGAGCHTMQPVAMDSLVRLKPSRVWVTREDQTKVMVEGPRMLENRLVGFVDGTYETMPAADVRQVLTRRMATGRTAALVAAGTLGVVGTVVLLSSTGTYDDPCSRSIKECVFQ